MTTELDFLRQFFQERGVRSDCPRCGSTEWTLNDKPSPWAGLWGAGANGEYTLDSPIFGVTVLICNNCGFVSPHSKHVFDRWMNSRGGK
jgi:ribosomal protein S27AE